MANGLEGWDDSSLPKIKFIKGLWRSSSVLYVIVYEQSILHRCYFFFWKIYSGAVVFKYCVLSILCCFILPLHYMPEGNVVLFTSIFTSIKHSTAEVIVSFICIFHRHKQSTGQDKILNWSDNQHYYSSFWMGAPNFTSCHRSTLLL